MSRIPNVVVAALLVALTPVWIAAQTLGDVAKQEGERRQGVKSTGKVITNKDLPTVPPPTEAPPAPSGSTAGGITTAADVAKPAADQPAVATGDPKADEKSGDTGKKGPDYWAGRMKALQEGLQRDQIFSDSLQSRINALTMDFVNRDDPLQRDRIGRDRQTAIDELDRVKKSIVDRTKAIAELEEEARRAGVPPGWLR